MGINADVQNDTAALSNLKEITSIGEECLPTKGFIYLPVVAVYLIAFAMALMFIVIMFLVYALQRAKSSGYRYISNGTSQAAINLHRSEFSRQASQETGQTAIRPLDGVTTDENHFNHSSSLRDVSRNNITTNTSNRRDSKIIRIIKNNNPQTNIILREQIKEICQGVLNNPIALRRRSIRDFLLEFEGLERRPSHKRLTREKSASTPQLDIYETVPADYKETTSNVDGNENDKISEHDNKLLQKTTEDLSNRTSQEHYNEDQIYDNPPSKPEPLDLGDNPVYDSPPSHPPKIVVNGAETNTRIISKNTMREDIYYFQDSGENIPQLKIDQ